jgi:glycerol-3-phosphate O-acyltransferase / dihydroxyacetone phosphate acyltransferase
MLSRWITSAAGWAAHEFYTLDKRGLAVPDGPVLVVANHPNALLDPLIVFRATGRVVRPLAKEPLFRNPFIGPVLKALGGLPVYRRQDHPDQMHQNERTFDAAIAALHAGDAVQIYPEGQSHSNPHLTPLKTGAARIALRAEAEKDWQLGLHIVPIGLTYTRKTFFRGRAVAVVGEAFRITDWKASYESDQVAAVKSLTDAFTQKLEALTLTVAQTEDAELIDTAERLYTREKGIASWREAEGLGDRLPRMQAFARALAWLRTNDPVRHRRLERRVRRYRTLSNTIGAGEGDVPPEYTVGNVAGYIAREAFMLGIGLPLAALAMVFWYPPYALNRFIVNRLNVDETGIATYKLGLSILMMPLTLIIWSVLAFRFFGWTGWVTALIVLPVLGIVLSRWGGRFDKIAQDARLFFNVLTHPKTQHKLAAERAELVREFDEIAAQVSD